MKKKKEKNCLFIDKVSFRMKKLPLTLLLSATFCIPSFGYANVEGEKVNLSYQIDQQRNISGQIIDENGDPLIGVSILVRGTSTGTITDIDGNFSLMLSEGQNILEVSYIGYETQLVTVGNQSHLTINLSPDTQTLDEVVVVGYGTVKKRDLTGSVASIKSSDITVSPTSNPMEALQGKVAGMDIMRTSGQVGSGVDIQLRGTRSIYGENSPLFIIDGIAGNYDLINPADIESIDILKDASSTAIYGSAGANGVVIITTKQGKQGKTTVNFDAYVGVSGFATYPSGMVGDEYINLKKEAYRTQHGQYPEFMSSIFSNPKVLEAYEQGKWINFVDDLLGNNAFNQNYNVSVNGGTEKTKFFASLNYNDERGMLKGDDRLRYGLRLNLDQTINKWAKIGINTNVNHTLGNKRHKSVFVNSLTFVPLGDPYNADGSINAEYLPGEQNPMSDEIDEQYVDNTRSTYLTSNGFLELTPLKGLKFRSVLGVDVNYARQGKFFGPLSIANITSGYSAPLASIENTGRFGYKWENILTYNFQVAKDHDFTVTGITSWAHNQVEKNYTAAQGQELTSQSFWNLAAGTDKQGVSSGFTQAQSMSYAARINYSYKGRYLVTLSNRWDGVSHLAQGHKWDFFPAAALAWRISDEAFMVKTSDWLSNLKLRVGYGVSGNSGGMGAYSSQTATYTFPQPVVFGDKGYPTIQYGDPYANPLIGWEKSYNTNIGLDLGFFNGRVDMTIDWYNTDTKDLLFKRKLPITSGVTNWGSPISTWQNIGETNNKGLEIVLSTQNIVKRNFTWSSTLSFTTNKDKIVALPDGDIIGESLFEGRSMRAFYDYKYLGIWSEAEKDEAAKYGCLPGDIKLATNPIITKDENGNEVSDDGVHAYSENDKMYLGSKNPDWYMGFQNNFKFHNFDLSIFAMIRHGQMVQSSLITRYDPTTSLTNSPAGIDYWTPENQEAYLPRPGLHSTASQYPGWSSLAYRKGSFLKIKNITLGYTLPKAVLSSLHMEKVRFYVTAYNPYTFAFDKQMRNQDPERNGSDDFPISKEFVFGVNVTF